MAGSVALRGLRIGMESQEFLEVAHGALVLDDVAQPFVQGHLGPLHRLVSEVGHRAVGLGAAEEARHLAQLLQRLRTVGHRAPGDG